MSDFDIMHVINSLRDNRPIFHSEKDLQNAFVDEVKSLYPNAAVNTEIVYHKVEATSDDLEDIEYSNNATRIDVLVSLDGFLYLVELKYKTKRIDDLINNEHYLLKEHGAEPDNMYLFLHDVYRLEDYIINKYNSHEIYEAYAVFITNNIKYQKEKSAHSVSKDFDLSAKKVKGGILRNLNEDRNQNIFLVSEYLTNWTEYSRVPVKDNNIFWISVFKVNKSKFL